MVPHVFEFHQCKEKNKRNLNGISVSWNKPFYVFTYIAKNVAGEIFKFTSL